MNPLEKVANLLRLRGRLEAPPFSFLNLGLLAYVGQQEALAQVQTGSIKVKCVCFGGCIDLVGCASSHAYAALYLSTNQQQLGDYSSRAGNLLWRSVYLVKQVRCRQTCQSTGIQPTDQLYLLPHPNLRQVSTRNRILVLFDWMKTRVFGRDISRW